MKRFLFGLCLIVGTQLSGCYCGWPPPVGPVEDEETSAVMPVPADTPAEEADVLA